MTFKLTIKAACRLAGIDRDRFNEHVAAGRFPCAPATIPGRARTFDPADMIALCLFAEMLDGGLDAARAGAVACEVAHMARLSPDSPTITLVETNFKPSIGIAYPTERVPPADEWDRTFLDGGRILKTTTFNIAFLRQFVAREIDEMRSIVGED